MNRQCGLGAIMAIVVLVILSALAAAMVSLGNTQAMSSAQDALATRAWLAARAGNEWGLFQALQPSGLWYWNPATGLPATPPCDASATGVKSQTLDLSSASGFWVTVTCTSQSYNEGSDAVGSRRVTVYTLDAVACTSAAGCPDATAAAGQTYVERHRRLVASAAAPE